MINVENFIITNFSKHIKQKHISSSYKTQRKNDSTYNRSQKNESAYSDYSRKVNTFLI